MNASRSQMIDSGFASVDHGRLYYKMTGSGEAVVLIHGNFGDLRYWDGQVAALSPRYHIIRYDVRGFGRSSLPVAGVPYSHIDDVAGLLKHLKISSAHIVGFSMGSGIAPERSGSSAEACRRWAHGRNRRSHPDYHSGI